MTRATNHNLEVASEEKQKKEKIVKKWKRKVMVVKHQRVGRQISLFSKEIRNHESDTNNEIDLV